MPYVNLTDLNAKIPAPFLSEALDDGPDSDPSAVWNSIAAAVGSEIDGILGSRYTVPFNNPIPAVVTNAAITLASEAIYLRRGKLENPFTGPAKTVRAQLADIGTGKQLLAPVTQRSNPAAILQRAGAVSGNRLTV